MNSANRKRATTMAELQAIQQKAFDLALAKKSIDSFKPRKTDVIITPFGKSGTTWTQQIFHTLRTRGDMDFEDISAVVPWIETSGTLNLDINEEQRASPRGFKSHLDYNLIPKGAKYINVIRDPVDAAYSMFKFMEGWFIEPGSITPDDFVSAGQKKSDYHTHFTSWWPHRDDDNVLYLVYEHMLKDPEQTIEQIAAFCDIKLDDELRSITLENSSLEFMQKHKNRFDDALMRHESEKELLPPGSDSAKVRAGKAGQHRFSDAVMMQFDELWQELIAPKTGFDDYASLIAALK